MKHSSISTQGHDNPVGDSVILGRINVAKVPHDDSVVELIRREKLVPTVKRLSKRLIYLQEHPQGEDTPQKIIETKRRITVAAQIAKNRGQYSLIEDILRPPQTQIA